MDKENQLSIKLLTVGDSQVGKSCLIKRYCEGRFVNRYITTIGVDYGVKKMNIKNRKIAVNFFDLSGDDDYEGIRNEFYKDSQGVLLIFDLGNKDSFLHLQKWEADMKKYGIEKNAIIVILGNKSDLKRREVEDKDVQKYAKSKGYEYYPTSASTGENVNDVFEAVFAKIVDNIEKDAAQYK